MYQLYLLTQILKNLGFNERTKTKNTSAVTSKILYREIEGKEMYTKWECSQIIGQLNFVGKLTRQDITYAMHQCVRCTFDPMESHKQAVLRIERYLLAT